MLRKSNSNESWYHNENMPEIIDGKTQQFFGIDFQYLDGINIIYTENLSEFLFKKIQEQDVNIIKVDSPVVIFNYKAYEMKTYKVDVKTIKELIEYCTGESKDKTILFYKALINDDHFLLRYSIVD